MKITLAKSAGFCIGVKRALRIAYETASTKNKVYMLGDIVHNEHVVKEIIDAGIKKIKCLSNGTDKSLLIRAHGASKKIINEALSKGYIIVDATCPMVKEIHSIAKKMERKKFTIIVIGDKKHDEVKGIVGQLKKKALIIEKATDIRKKIKGKIKKAAVVVQSTQDINKVKIILEKLKSRVDSLKFYNTICKPTSKKQADIRELPLNNDLMIIIGSRASANTKRLYEISKKLNKHSYWVHSSKDLKVRWFKNAKRVGITAGASTPDLITRDVINQIRNYS